MTVNKFEGGFTTIDVDPEAALSRLADLPLDEVPPFAPLPSGSHVPWATNPTFVGREQDLKDLAAIVKGGETAAIGQIAAATGLGGIGKTQLASAFAHAYGQYFLGGVYWLSFAEPKEVPNELVLCGAKMFREAGFGELPVAEQVRLVRHAWEDPLPRLLIFDNCEDEGLLAEWRPSTGGCRVLVTSRRQDWSVTLGVKGLPLGLLSPIESVELLRKHRPELAHDDPALTGIAETLGYLPLALHLAGSFLERYQHSDVGDPAAYLADLCREDLLDHRSMIQGSHSPTGHEMHVANTFALSLRLMDTEDPTDKLALDLLTRTACFAPGQPMPKELLLGSLGDGTEPDELVREDALSRLLALGLLERDHAGSLILHRLLALFAQRSAADALDAARDAVEAHLSGEARRINNSGLTRPLRGWQGHLRHVAELSEERMSDSSASLWNSLGYHLITIGDLSGAKEALERALRIDEAAYGPEHPNVATSINNLGFVLESEGDLSGAKAAYERALRIDEAAYGPDHPTVAIRVNNLGGVLNAEGDLSGAKAAYERALRIDEAAYGPDHPKVANRVNNLGGVLNAEGDLAGAKVAFERALQIDESTLGIDHPKVAIRVNNLGLVLKAEGDLSGAKAAYGRALRIDEAAYGPDHPNVAIRVNNLGEVLSAEGDLSGAKAACERALRIFETSLGPDHPSTQTVRENLQILDSVLTK